MSISDVSSVLSDNGTNSSPVMDQWESDWRSKASESPCGSCTGRACTVCSIRVGGAPGANGQPTGYAPKILDYFNPNTATDTANANGLSDPNFSSLPSQDFLVSGAAGPVAKAASLAAPAPTNPIVLENMLPGTPESEWLIDKGDTSIEGYAAQFTIDHGQRVDFKINTAATNYRIDIYRIGYYGGDGARKVATINENLATPQVQPNPLFDPTTKLVDAGNWSVSASWNIPTDAVSGVYIAELTRLDAEGGKNIIPFIVRDDEDPSDITFQTSDTTWEAYNDWGGYNLYGGIDDSGHAGRADAVSYNRPFVTRDGGFSSGPQDFLFGEEYPAIRWLEENGYDVNYISGIDTAESGAQLLNSKIFLSVGHDEYWSADQRANVEAARDAGVNLAFMSGNEVFWETRWEPSIDGSGTPYKTLVSYKELWSNADTDPGATTSTWRDPVLGAGDPENSLTGTLFTVDSYRLDTITIPYDLSNFRFWNNTAVANIQPGQVYSLTPNLLGYEWDSDLDNGSRPAGLIDLSSTTVDVNSLLLDNGNIEGPGTATHSLTLYRAPSGALVFGAGTVYWSWGLDSHHDNETTPTDPNVQQAMVNLFAEMGVQPETLMQSLAVAEQSTDFTAPTSTITSPTSSDSFVTNQPVVITGTAVDTGGGTIAVVEVSTDGGATWHRADGFENWTYNWVPLAGGTYKIESRAVDDSVNLEKPGPGISVSVAAAPTTSLFAPSLTPVILSDTDPRLVNVGVKFTSSQSGSIEGIKFYKGEGDGGTHIGSIWTSTGTLLGSATFTNETASGWQTVIFSNPISVAAGVTYVASYHSNGHYADTEHYFTAAQTNGPLTAQATNGFYTYSNDVAFPTTDSKGVNYFVDVIFSPTNTVNQPPVGVNDNGFATTRDTPISFAASLLLANDTDPNGDILSITGVGSASNGTVSFNSQTNVITFTPNAGFTGNASFGYAISDGRGGMGAAIVNLTVDAPVNGASLFSPSDVPTSLSDSDNVQVNLGVKFVSAAPGVITGVRYYKGAGDVGTHTGSLWTSTGTLLASATFVSETQTGWQTVLFSNPVSVTAGTTYVASFHSDGHYTTTSNYFATDHVNGLLTAPAGGNGLYTYGNANLFPTSSFAATNYWVDVVFSTNGATNQPPVAVNDSGFVALQNTPVTIAASALLANDTDPDGNPLTVTSVSGGINGTATFNAQTNIITFTPTAGFTGVGKFNYAITDGQGGTANASVSVTIDAPPVAVNDSGFSTARDTALSIAASALLANDSDPNGDPLSITGVSGGSNGTATFNGQTKTVTFTPTAGYTGPAAFTYTVSDGLGGTANATVSLTVNPPVNQPPVATNDSGFIATRNTALAIAGSALLANDSDPNGDPLTITGVSGGVNGTATFNAQNNTVTFTPNAGYIGSAAFSYSISDGHGGAANATVSLTVSDPQPPVAVNDSGFSTNRDTALTIAGAALLANDSDPNGDPITITGVSGGVNGTASFNAQTNVITFTPIAGYTGPANFTYAISDGQGGTASAAVSLTVNTPPATVNLFAASDTPAKLSDSDSVQVNLGVKFVAAADGTISGVKYYKSAGDIGTHTGSLWSSTGTLLASATFTNETASGWQTVSFNSPVSITAGTTYVASFHSDGHYATTSNYFKTDHVSGLLTAPANSNGVYTYGNANLFPTSSFGATNYWVDVVYSPNGTANLPPVAANDSGLNATINTALTIPGATLLANDSDPNGDPIAITGVSGGVNGAAAFNAQTNTVTFTPNANYTGNASFNYAISDGKGGVATANAALIVSDPAVSSLFSVSSTPGTINSNDPKAVELGVKFQASADGEIDGIRFYKGPNNTGAHVANLWTSTGTLLASATFTNETASGWQQVNFASPVSITAGTTYVASYHTNGNYSESDNFFANALTNGPLTAPSSASIGGNGVYAYGSASLFPTSSFGSTNYDVDVLFRSHLAA